MKYLIFILFVSILTSCSDINREHSQQDAEAAAAAHVENELAAEGRADFRQFRTFLIDSSTYIVQGIVETGPRAHTFEAEVQLSADGLTSRVLFCRLD